MRVSRFELEPETGEEARALASQIRALPSRPAGVEEIVAGILQAVRERGDAAVAELTRRFDSGAAPEALRVPGEKLDQALATLDAGVREGLEVALANVRRVSEAELSDGAAVDLPQGHRVELRELAVRAAGAYVPGGRHPYPSTVVMCCTPARVAGVERVAVATPPSAEGEPHAAVLAACALCEADEVYVMGGAQAIAALAFGTESVEAVDVIVGPGNLYVQEAKRQVVGVVGIDGVAGPSELVIVADGEADPELIGLDLAAQAEHGPDSLVAVLSPSDGLLERVEARARELSAARETVSDAPLALVGVPDLDSAVRLADAIAPEHLELACAGADELARAVRASGCVFVGSGGTAFGDYAAGSNHVLPTGGAARFDGPLGVARFRRRQTLVSLPQEATRALAPYVSNVARAEGFPLHAESAEARSTTT